MCQRQLRVHPLQPSILGLELFQPPKLRDVHASVPGFPVVDGRIAHPVLARQLHRLRASIELLEDRDDLLFGKLGLLHSSSPLGKTLLRSGPDRQGVTWALVGGGTCVAFLLEWRHTMASASPSNNRWRGP